MLLPLVVDELAEVVVEARCFKYGLTMDEAAGRLDMTNVRLQMRGNSVGAIALDLRSKYDRSRSSSGHGKK